jgi:hypothetical protein
VAAHARSTAVRRALPLALLVLASGLGLLPLPAPRVETVYSCWLFPAIQRRLTAWTNLLPVAVTDVLIVAAAIGAGWLGIAAVRDARTRGAWRASARLVWRALTVAAGLYLLFLVAWGLNYRREPLRSRLDFARARVTPASALDLAQSTIRRLNELHGVAHAAPWPGWEEIPSMLGPAFARVQRQLADVEPCVPGIPKRSALTFYLERAGVSGFTDPYALEIVVDRSQLPFERPFVAAHEWGHLAGYADESEANFVGWLVCLQGPPQAEYSGDLALALYLLGALSPGERAALARTIGPGPRQDIEAIRLRSARRWPALERPAWWLYDRFLRANRVEGGVRSYGAALELMIGTKFGPGWVPMTRGGRR